MKTFTFFFVIISAAIAGFAALNWSALSAPRTLSLGFTAIVAPLGWVMLVLLAVVSVFFLLWVVAAQVSAIREARRLSREIEVTNDLAREAEANRFAELHQYIERELKTQSIQAEASHQALLSKLSDIQHDILEDQIERDHTRAGHRS